MERNAPGTRRKQVAVFGAGIAGLTAAQELAERGFLVEVWERNAPSARDRLMGENCDIGGVARTQWSRVERIDPFEPIPNRGMVAAQPIRLIADEPEGSNSELLRFRIVFDAPPNDPIRYKEEGDATTILDRIAHELEHSPEVRAIEVRGYSSEKACRGIAMHKRNDYLRANHVAEELKARLAGKRAVEIRGVLSQEPISDPDALKIIPLGLGYGHAADPSMPDHERDYVCFDVRETWLPGEHGFRYFPGYYRNIIDTMRRIPIPDDHDADYRESIRTVFDNLVPTPVMGLVSPSVSKPFPYLVQPTGSLRVFYDQLLGMLESTGSKLDDMSRFWAKILKYATSCSERRATYEDLSWYEFLEADQFSEEFRTHLDGGGESLVSMRAKMCDARSYGTASIQVIANAMDPKARTDATLNAPTSLALFEPWRRYLQRQGVIFRQGELVSFHEGAGEAWPVVRTKESATTTKRAGSEEKTSEIFTVIDRDYYVVALGPNDVQDVVRSSGLRGNDFDRIRTFPLGDPCKAITGGALEHMSGIQYYFATDIRGLQGHFLFPESAYRLSAIFQPQFWTQRRGWWSSYRGVLSIDISNWHNAPAGGAIAWDCTQRELAESVLSQIRQGLRVRGEPERSTGLVVPEPLFFHIDQDIEYDPHSGKPIRNKSPFLMSRPGEYRLRPGNPDNYQLNGRIVLAGAFQQTHIRLTTMEAANESGRHAANAILRAEGFGLPNDETRGELCQIFKPEDHEPPDLRALVELDQKLFGLGLPHVLDTFQGLASSSILSADREREAHGSEDGPSMTLRSNKG